MPRSEGLGHACLASGGDITTAGRPASQKCRSLMATPRPRRDWEAGRGGRRAVAGDLGPGELRYQRHRLWHPQLEAFPSALA